MKSRQEVVTLVESWVGKNERDGSYKEIIDIYNSHNPLPRGIKMAYNWAWCACTWSALAIKLGFTNIMPIEISCGYLIDAAKKMGCWVERDDYIPSPGDAVLYDWGDSGVGDNIGWPDHVGTVTYVNPMNGYFVVTEGNYSNSVKKRTVSINGKGIRGFIKPKYDNNAVEPPALDAGKDVKTIAHEVIAGQWGNMPDRQTRLEAQGYNYEEVRAEVNRILNGSAVKPTNPEQDQNQPIAKTVKTSCYAQFFDEFLRGAEFETTANLYCRNDAGQDKKALCLIPKGTKVTCWGFYSTYKENVTRWLLIDVVLDGVQYSGFCCNNYLRRV